MAKSIRHKVLAAIKHILIGIIVIAFLLIFAEVAGGMGKYLNTLLGN